MDHEWIRPLRSDGNIVITNVRLAYVTKEHASRTWSVEIKGGRVIRILPSSEQVRSTSEVVDAQGGLMLPSFCHSHIHLDKCFILGKCGELVRGDFQEAMQVTKDVKSEFPRQLDDLYARGARIIKESVEHGVTAIRAHVEVDVSVGFSCLDVALKLQHDYRTQCDVQLAVFAQEPLFDSADHQKPGKNFRLLEEAAQRHGVSVVGSAPYVEPNVDQAKKNIGLIFDIVDACGVDQVDFHLDYNLDPGSEPLIYEVISQARRRCKFGNASVLKEASQRFDGGITNPPTEPSNRHAKSSCPRITIGHATRLQLFSTDQWTELAAAISELPITLIGLPQSDMYMQGRASWDEPLGAPRGTLRVPYLAAKYGIEIAMSVNNVENAFTPQGSLDPLSLCSFGVGVFQSASPADIRALARSVTITSKHAIGHTDVPHDLSLSVGDPADLVILHHRTASAIRPTEPSIVSSSSEESSPLQNAVLNPLNCFDRTTIKAGRVVACRRSVRWFAGDSDPLEVDMYPVPS